MAINRKKLSDQIRDAVDKSGLSRYRIAKELGIAESTMSRFMGGAGLTTAHLDALAALLGLEIKTTKKAKGKQ